MLHGALKTIREYRPCIAITTYHDRSHAAEIISGSIMMNLDYQIKTKGILEVPARSCVSAW